MVWTFLAEQEEHDEVASSSSSTSRSEDFDECLEDLVEVEQMFVQERISNRRQERVQNRTVKHTINTTVPQITRKSRK